MSASVVDELYQCILDRREKLPEGSYTAYLFAQGEDKILKKVGEEAAEVIIAAKNGAGRELVAEVADLFYHVLVLLACHGLRPEDVYAELKARRK